MIFIDTNFYVSLENKADSNHAKAKEILEKGRNMIKQGKTA